MGLRFDVLVRKGLDGKFPLVDYLIDHPELYPDFCKWIRVLELHEQTVLDRMFRFGRSKKPTRSILWWEYITNAASDYIYRSRAKRERIREKYRALKDQVADALGYIDTPDEEYLNCFITPDGELSDDWASWEDQEIQEINDEIAAVFEDGE